MLRPWPINFHARRFGHSHRAHIADDSDNFPRDTGQEQTLPDWILTRINLFRSGLTDQTNFLSVGGVVLIELTASQKRDSPCLEISGSNVVTGRDRALLDWRNFTIVPRIKITTEANQRNIAADGRALETRETAQLMECLFNKTLTRRRVEILRGRQCDRTGPKILGTEADVLLTQADETRDEQRCTGQQRDRERDLRADEDFAEALLAHTAARAAAALFQPINQIGVRTLKRRINSHQETGQDRQSNRE